MKKVFMVVVMLFVGMFTYCNAQDVKVNINNHDASSNTSEFKINGISSSEDIGGVDVQFIDKNNHQQVSVVLTNYNSFAVTVLFKVTGCGFIFEKTMNVVIEARGTKQVDIAEGLAKNYSLAGIIVRKIAQ